MPSDPAPTIRMEIGHVLFIDIVGYSMLLINEQTEVLQKLNELVRGTERVRAAESANKLIRLPSGDGMALVFRDNPEAPAECALEISQALKSHTGIGVRMGIHSGPVNEVVDVNERANIAGSGINLAQRVMDCGDAGHILLSKRVAEDLAQYRHWQPRLHDLGPCEVKHGLVVSVFNLYTETHGNPAVPTRLQQQARVSLAGKAPDTSRGTTRKNGVLIGAGLLAAILVLVGYWFLVPHTAKRVPLPPASTAPAPLPEKRIAILPFKPLVAESRDPVLELGMADTLITKLSNSREIIVSSLAAVRKFGGLDQDPLSAGRELRVDSVLEGNMQKSGDKIRVTARLIKVADGASLWAGAFDEKFTDVFTVQNDISQKVVDALALQLSGEEKRRLNKRYTEKVAAYQLYLTGRFYWNNLTPPDLQKSISYFQQAIDLDPTYAPAYFGLAEAYRALTMTSDVRPLDAVPQAKVAAQKAIQLDDTLAEPHVSLAFIHTWFDWDWGAAEREAKKAIELNPNFALAHSAYGNLLTDLGRHEEAAIEAKRALELDPVSLITNLLDGSFLYHARNFPAAETRLRKTLELGANFWIARLFLGKIYLERAQYGDAITEFQKARELSHGNSEAISMIGYAKARSGDVPGARAILEELQIAAAHRYIPPHNVAVVYLGLGEMDECFAWLEKAYAEHDAHLSFLRVDPKWDAVRADPRFQSLLQRIGLG